ncbi:hypothetical protein [Candidatus Enterovibrio escicola]|nr:hypothetical protein [Candidatus Enterovibrio escacola]
MIKNRGGIEKRPYIADAKTQFSHFEIDSVSGLGTNIFFFHLWIKPINSAASERYK